MIAEVRQAPVAHRAEPLLADLSPAGLRVIVVDNDPAAVDLIAEALTRAGGEARGGGSAEIDGHTPRQWPPAVRVSDIHLRGLDDGIGSPGASHAGRGHCAMRRGREPMGEAPPNTESARTVSKPIIAVFNASDDTVELLRTALESQGFHTVIGHIPDVKSGEL